MPPTLNFLVVDDDADVRFLNRRALEKAFVGCVVAEAATSREALAHTDELRFDAVLADHHLSGEDGLACILNLRARGVPCPIILVTGNDNPAIHAEALTNGATRVFPPAAPDFISYLRTVVPNK